MVHCKHDTLDKYHSILLLGYFVSIITSCSYQPIFLPTTLAPAKTYSAGKGEAGIRSFFLIPDGADFKVGITNNIQLSGITYPINGVNGAGVYEGSLQCNIDPSEHDTYLHIFGIGGGIYYSTKAVSFSNSQMNYIYEGYYPGLVLANHVSINFPLRLYEYMGRYNCTYDVCPSSIPGQGAQTLEHYWGVGFVPEMDIGFDWTYVAFRLGLSVPVEMTEGNNPERVILFPNLSTGFYGKW